MTQTGPLSREPMAGRSAQAGRPRLSSLLAAATVAIALSGAGAVLLIGDTSIKAAPGTEAVELAFDEWTLESAKAEIPAGPTTFIAENRGMVDHELLVVKTEIDPAELPQGIAGPLPRLAGDLVLGKEHQHVSSLGTGDQPKGADHIVPGETEAYEVDLEPGQYALFCNLAGHYRRGQYTGLTVSRD